MQRHAPRRTSTASERDSYTFPLSFLYFAFLHKLETKERERERERGGGGGERKKEKG
jgi:hypothetical protein